MNKEERLQYLFGLIEEEPNDPFGHYALVLEKVEMESDSGVSLWAQFQNRFPDYLPAYYLYGTALVNNNQAEDALDIWKKGIKLAEMQKDTHALAELKSATFNLMLEL